MSPGPADQVNAKELAGRAAVVERKLGLGQLERVVASGGLPGTRISARLQFGTFERRTTVDVRVDGTVVLQCQRCLQPCECAVADLAQLIVVTLDTDEVPEGYEPVLGSAEQLSLTAVIEEQVLLALPLVPAHEDAARCAPVTGALRVEPAAAATQAARATSADTQMPFANLRELLENKNEH